MKVMKAAAMGMCFGVRDALEVMDAQERPESVTVYGELVHNEEVLKKLAQRGFRSTGEERGGALPASELLLITAHGISDRERRRMEEHGKTLIDTTCPLVTRAHTAAQRLQNDGYFVVVIGKPDHVEVQGLVGDLTRFAVVPNPESVCEYDGEKLGIICQTTTPPSDAERIVEAIRQANSDKEIRFVNTICRPTRERQQAALELIEQVEALVVVGGANSNNTKQLARLAEQRGVPVFRTRNAADLDPAWFQPYNVVGLTAGTSTLDRTVEEVHQALLAL